MLSLSTFNRLVEGLQAPLLPPKSTATVRIIAFFFLENQLSGCNICSYIARQHKSPAASAAGLFAVSANG